MLKYKRVSKLEKIKCSYCGVVEEREEEVKENSYCECCGSILFLFGSYLKKKSHGELDLNNSDSAQVEGFYRQVVDNIEWLSKLDKPQILASIYSSDERLTILNALREKPISESKLKEKLKKIKTNTNMDLLLHPFLKLNMIRKEFFNSTREKNKGSIKNGENYFFLIKDLMLIRIPPTDLLNILRNHKDTADLYRNLREEVKEFFVNYDFNKNPLKIETKLAQTLLNPEIYNLFRLLRRNYYLMNRFPKIFEDVTEIKILIKVLKDLNVIIEVRDKNLSGWATLLTDIQIYEIAPKNLLKRIIKALQTEDPNKKISYKIAQKAITLIETTEKVKKKFYKDIEQYQDNKLKKNEIKHEKKKKPHLVKTTPDPTSKLMLKYPLQHLLRNLKGDEKENVLMNANINEKNSNDKNAHCPYCLEPIERSINSCPKCGSDLLIYSQKKIH